jgi:uncharacterized protein YyaL (SSP411 family)
MLYDNAQLLHTLALAYRAGKQEIFRQVASETAEYLKRDLRHPEGGLYSAEDADSFEDEKSHHKKEGAFYVWSKKELDQVLDSQLDSQIFCQFFHVESTTNTVLSPRSDPHGEFQDVNVLIALDVDQLKKTAEEFDITEADVLDSLSRSRSKLFETRCRRPRPFLDDKVVTAWNGMALNGLCSSHQVFSLAFPPSDEVKSQADFLEIATNLAGFVRKYLYDEASGRLTRNFREGPSGISAFLADYVFMIQGLIRLYECTANSEWLEVSVCCFQKRGLAVSVGFEIARNSRSVVLG